MRSKLPVVMSFEGTPEAGPWGAQWLWVDRPGLETVQLCRIEGGIIARGVVVVELEGAALRLRYDLSYGLDWRFERASFDLDREGTSRHLEIVCDATGEWSVDGVPRPDLAGSTDLDVMVSPFTNTPALRTLGLGAGEARVTRVAYLALPSLEVRAVEQEYLRLDADEPPRRFRYRNLATGFVGELEVDSQGLVVEYGPWHRWPDPASQGPG